MSIISATAWETKITEGEVGCTPFYKLITALLNAPDNEELLKLTIESANQVNPSAWSSTAFAGNTPLFSVIRLLRKNYSNPNLIKLNSIAITNACQSAWDDSMLNGLTPLLELVLSYTNSGCNPNLKELLLIAAKNVEKKAWEVSVNSFSGLFPGLSPLRALIFELSRNNITLDAKRDLIQLCTIDKASNPPEKEGAPQIKP